MGILTLTLEKGFQLLTGGSLSNSYALLTIVLLVVGVVFVNTLTDPLRPVPGPFIAKFTSLYYVYHFFKADTFITLHRLHKKCGRVVRVGPRILSFNSAKAIREIYNGASFQKTPAYKNFDVEGPNMFSALDTEFHSKIRRTVAPGFTNLYLKAMEDIIQNSGMVSLTKRYDEDCKNGETIIDLYKGLHYSAADVVGDLVFGQDFGMVTRQVDHPFMGWLGAYQRMMGLVGLIPFGQYFKPWLFPSGVENEKKVRQFCEERIQQRKANPTDRKDIFGLLMNAKDPVSGARIPEDTIAGESVVFFVAGTDSTSNTMTLIFLNILKRPVVYNRVAEELIAAFPVRDEKIPMGDLTKQRLPYFWAAIQETLRCFPIIPNGLPRWSEEKDTSVDGIFVPSKTVCVVPLFALHRNKEIFGEDADEFNPDRWLRGNSDEMQKYCLPFSYGPRNCVAKNLAMMEIYLTVAYLLRRFEIRLVDPAIPVKQIQQAFNSVVDVDEVKVYIKKRE